MRPFLGFALLFRVAQSPFYLTALLISQRLHFGDYGGLSLKILWCLLDSIAIVVLGSSVYLWWERRRISADDRFASFVREADVAIDSAATRGP